MIDNDKVTKVWNRGDVQLFLATCGDHYCGYCTFPQRPVREQGYSGFLEYVPVHGGITYTSQELDGKMTYGFDCAHSGDDKNPDCQDEKWLSAEAERMAEAI